MAVGYIRPELLRQAWAMPERDLEDSVRSLCGSLGLAVQKDGDPRRSWLKGWPDLVIIGTAVLFVECKSEGGDLTPEQRQVRHRLIAAGQQYRVWKPTDLLLGTIAAELAGISRIRER